LRLILFQEPRLRADLVHDPAFRAVFVQVPLIRAICAHKPTCMPLRTSFIFAQPIDMTSTKTLPIARPIAGTALIASDSVLASVLTLEKVGATTKDCNNVLAPDFKTLEITLKDWLKVRAPDFSELETTLTNCERVRPIENTFDPTTTNLLDKVLPDPRVIPGMTGKDCVNVETYCLPYAKTGTGLTTRVNVRPFCLSNAGIALATSVNVFE